MSYPRAATSINWFFIKKYSKQCDTIRRNTIQYTFKYVSEHWWQASLTYCMEPKSEKNEERFIKKTSKNKHNWVLSHSSLFNPLTETKTGIYTSRKSYLYLRFHWPLTAKSLLLSFYSTRNLVLTCETLSDQSLGTAKHAMVWVIFCWSTESVEKYRLVRQMGFKEGVKK